MILGEIIAAALLLSLASGGSIRSLARQRLKGETVLLLLLPLQLLWALISHGLRLACAPSVMIWLLMMVCIAAILVINSRRHWMLCIAAIGIVANVVVIGVNQGMPVSMEAASEIGATRVASRAAMRNDCLHQELDGDTMLPILSDIIAVPGPEWQRAVVSVGDLLLALGLGGWVYSACRDSKT